MSRSASDQIAFRKKMVAMVPPHVFRDAAGHVLLMFIIATPALSQVLTTDAPASLPIDTHTRKTPPCGVPGAGDLRAG